MSKYSINKAYEDIKKFNEIAGNLDNVTDEKIDNQISVTFEEITEMIDGFEEENKVKFLDGILDSFVTICGIMQMAEAQGYDIIKGLQKVNINNLSKFQKDALQSPKEFFVSYNAKHEVFVIKDENGKVRKPLNFVSVDISNCVPKENK